MPTYYHLKENDYSINFPYALSVVPVMVQKHTFFDDWVLNMMYAMTLNIEEYLIAHKATLEG